MAQPGEKVWVRDGAEVWAPGVVEARTGAGGAIRLSVATKRGTKNLAFATDQDVDEDVKRRNDGDPRSCEDLIALPHLHEPAILHVLSRQRGASFDENRGDAAA